MFTALGLAILDQDARILQWADAAQPNPIVARDGQILEFKGNSGLPLGVMKETSYADHELKLKVGDIVVLYTNGIIKAENEKEEIYGTRRLEQVVMNMDSTVSSEEIIKAISRDVADFAGDARQRDDMAVVVLRKI
jgi:serine phosphatase RsbU (regulator of sigma subunit)